MKNINKILGLALSLTALCACGDSSEDKTSNTTADISTFVSSETPAVAGAPKVILEPGSLKDFQLTLTGCNRYQGIWFEFSDSNWSSWDNGPRAIEGAILDETESDWEPPSIGVPEKGYRGIHTSIDKCKYEHSANPFFKNVTCENVIFSTGSTLEMTIGNLASNTLLGCNFAIKKRNPNSNTWTTIRDFPIDLNGNSSRLIHFPPKENEVKVIPDTIHPDGMYH